MKTIYRRIVDAGEYKGPFGGRSLRKRNKETLDERIKRIRKSEAPIRKLRQARNKRK